MNNLAPRTLTTAEDLARAGLITEDAAGDVGRVTARYALAIPPAVACAIQAPRREPGG